MNLLTEYLENSFEIKSKTINTLVIEDSGYFAKFIKALTESLDRRNDDFVLMEDFNEIDISSSTEIIFDLFGLDANSASILKKLYGELITDMNTEEMYYEKNSMESAVLKFMDDLIYRSDFSLKAGELNYQNLFKAMEVEFDYDKDSTLERLTEYIKVTSELANKKLFIIVNMDSFLS